MGLVDSIGGALGLGGGSEPAESAPWSEQIPYLKEGFSEAQRLYNQGPSQYYPGQTVAGTNPNIQSYFGGAPNLAQGGLNAQQMMGGYGSQMAGGLPQSQAFYSDAMNQYFNPYATLEFQQQFNAPEFQTQNPYQTDQYNQIIADSVANNPVLQSQIEMGQADINRNLQENILPSIASGAVGTGNTGSTRRGVAEGVAMRGAMEQGSDLATNLQTNAYNQALNQAGQWAGGQQQVQRDAMAGAMNRMRGAELGAAGTQFGQGYQMDAAGNLANMGQYGVNLMPQAYDLGSKAYQDLLGAGAYERGMDQENLLADRERWDFEQNAPWDNLNRYQSLVAGNYGGTSSGGGPSAGNQLMNIGAQLGAAYLMGG